MKTLIQICFALLLASTCRAQITNGIKISGLPTVSSITGNETVPLNQSGVTKSATVAQIISAATAQDNATTNGLAALLATEVTARAGVSNFFTLVAGTNAAGTLSLSNYTVLSIGTNATALTTASNYLALRVGTNATALTTASNYLALVAATNAAAANVTSNQVAALTNGTGTLSLSAVSAKVIRGTTQGTVTMDVSGFPVLTSTNVFLDFSAGSQQVWIITAANNGPNIGQYVVFYPTNFSDGQTFSLLLPKATPSRYGASTPATLGSAATIIGGNVIVTNQASSGHGVFLNWLVIGTNIVFSGGGL